LLLLPIVLAVAWLRPRGPGSRAAYLVVAGLLISVIVHALTSYPYLHDELLRRLPGTGLGPISLILIAVLGAIAWFVVDREFAPHRARLAASLTQVIPRLLAAGLLVAFALWWSLRSHAPAGRPYARLDAAPILLGVPLLLAAAIGAIVIARRWRAHARDVWLLALAAVVPCTALLYAPRELPVLAFFYYGRYLVPELLPVAALLATAALEAGVRALMGPDPSRFRRHAAAVSGMLVGAGLIVSSVGPVLRYPQLRLREHAAAGQAVSWLAERLPPGSIVIAGGEGWHNGHTHNQIGGALAMAHGVEVLPYRTREDAWLSAWELLVAGPSRRGHASPPVFLLVNEAAHQYTRDDSARVALIDDQLWAPFRVERASLLELFVHALTPVPDQLPTRVARHELRMALLRLSVDPAALARIHSFALADPPAGVTISGGYADDGQACVAPNKPLRIELPRPDDARHVVLVTADADPRSTPRWTIQVDGRALAVEPPAGLRPHPRASLGPLPLPLPAANALGAPLVIEVTAPKLPDSARSPGPCPWGRVAEIRTLPHERSTLVELDPDRIEAVTLPPDQDLGQAIVPATWVPGRSLSRYRPGTTRSDGATPDIAGVALVLPANDTLSFAPIDLPLDANGRVRELELIVTLAGTWTGEDAELRVFVDEHELGTLTPPAMRRGSWVGPALRFEPTRARASFRLELLAEHGSVEVRDLALFVHTPGIESSTSSEQ
jgi:hypothetical protein